MSEEEEPMDTKEQTDSSSSSEDEDQELLSRAEELEKQILSNKYLYDAHVEIVNVFRKLGDLNSMREAYQRFHECFPLTPKLWLDWLKDEIKIASTAEEQKRLLDIFDKAVEDYLSVELWIEYAQYSIGVNDIQTTRSILERGLTAVGLHTSEGSLLWDTLRELEHAHISLTEEGSEEWKAQLNRLADVFKRQLSVPLLGMENTYHEWNEWVKSLPDGVIDPKPIEWGYKKAIQALEIYKPFEEKLLATESNEGLFEVYKEYIKVVKDPSAVLCLYERAAVTLCLVPNFWVDYCMYAFKLGEAAINISSRALRNCPWSEELWIVKLRILENLKRDENEILACFEQGTLSISPVPGLELWLSYLEYVHRNSNDVEKLDKLFSQAIQQFGFDNDPSCKLSRWHARLLAKRGDMPTARKIWGTILHQPFNKGTASVWLEYANLERQFGDPSKLRSLFQRAISTRMDWPQYIAEEWLMFEREFGTLENILNCVKKTKNIAKVEVQNPPPSEGVKKDWDTTLQKGKKRRHDNSDEKSLENKKAKNLKVRDEKKNEVPPPVVNKHIDKDPKKTVFVSNLHPDVGQEQLKELFPKATLIDLVVNRSGISRGYGFIQFSTEEEAMTALARDRVPLDGRPVYISEVKPEKADRKSKFKYPNLPEANKLFVRGLPKQKTKEEIEEIFKPYGCIDVRLVIQKNGQSKGLAYVEFETDEAAKKALAATDQMQIDENAISVAISAPPPKNQPLSKVSEPIRHARSRLQVPLIPRSLQVKNTEKVEKDPANGSSSTTSAAPKKSNADFRNMLLKK